MHRQRRDAQFRFLFNHPNHTRLNPYEAPDVNPFDALYQDLDNLNPLEFELSKNNLYFLFGPPKEEPCQVTPPQRLMQGNPPPGGNNLPPSINLTFELPISDLHDNANLKIIPASSLPKFYGLVIEDPNNFLF